MRVEDRSAAEYKVDDSANPKFTAPLVDMPKTIQVIPKQVMREQGATTLTEALRNTPGAGAFFLGENGNTTTGDAIFMRGFDASGSIFVDGIRDVGSISRDVFNLEQIEVVKGPARHRRRPHLADRLHQPDHQEAQAGRQLLRLAGLRQRQLQARHGRLEQGDQRRRRLGHGLPPERRGAKTPAWPAATR